MEYQFDLFDVLYDDYKFPKDRPIRIVESFAGIGTQKMAFNKLGLDHEVVAIIEVDKFALLSYASIHTNYLEVRDTYFEEHDIDKDTMVDLLQDRNIGYNFASDRQSILHGTNIETVRDYYLATILTNNLGDISKVNGEDLPKNIDMFTYSFPCTDLSKAGTQSGLGKGTRSGLVYEVFRIVEELITLDNAPKTLAMENVIDLVQRKFVEEFGEMQVDLEKMGYSNYVNRMNARDYGVAQNRDRVFMISILGEYNFQSPKPLPLEKKLKDYLEENVDESFYLSDKMFAYLNSDHPKHKRKHKFENNQKPTDYEGVANTITTRESNVVDSTFIKIPEDTKQGYAEAQDGDGVYINRPHQKRGVVQKGMIQTLKTSGSDVGVVVYDDYNSNIRTDQTTMGTITTNCGTSALRNGYKIIENELRIRKLVPIETWRLMGIEDEDFNKAQSVTSNAQLYKQAGNAIVVDVFANLIKSMI